jgi:hypothetical protein
VEALIAQPPFDILYDRLDLVRIEGRLARIEVELIEPIFSFNLVLESSAHLANDVKVRIETIR